MTPAEAAKLVNTLRDNWDSPAWSQVRYDLFVEAILPYPYAIAAPAIGKLILRGVRSYRVLVDDVTRALDFALDVARLSKLQQETRLLLPGPKDPAVGELLRATIKTLEARSRRGFGAGGAAGDPPAAGHRPASAQRPARRR